MYLRPRRRALTLALLSIAAGLLIAACWPMSVRLGRALVMPSFSVVERWEIGTLRVSIEEATDPDALPPRRVRVDHRGRTVIELATFYPEIYSIDDTPAGRRLLLSPDSSAVLAIMEHSGGSGGRFSMTMVAIPESDEPFVQPRLLGVYEDLLLRDVDGDGIAEGLAIEHALAHVLTSNAGSPRPTLVHRWDSSRRMFVPALDLQRVPAWSTEEYVRAREAVLMADAAGEDRVATLLAMVSERIYGGQADDGIRLFVESWPGPATEMRAALDQYLAAVEGSTFGAFVRAVNERGDVRRD